MKSSFPVRSSDQWCIEEKSFKPGHIFHYESIFALANGYAGLRGSLEMTPAIGDAGFYIAGVYDRLYGFVHEIVSLPCWLGVGVNVDGFEVDIRRGRLLQYRRWLDMRQGMLFTRIVWRDAGRHTSMWESVRLMHAARRHVGLLWARLTALDYSANLHISSRLDAWLTRHGSASGRNHYADLSFEDNGALGLGMGLTTRNSGIRVFMSARLDAEGAEKRFTDIDDDRAGETLSLKIAKGQTIEFCKRFVAYTSRDTADSRSAALAEAGILAKLAPAEIVGEHVKAWDCVWRDADVEIDGDERMQKALRFNIFHLASLANPDDERVSLGAKGLHGNGYSGLVFWDTEIYLLPFYVFTRPEAARALLKYRWHFLPDARQNAADMGARGAKYPWNSSIQGRDVYGRGWQEHVGSDVAYGLDLYRRATGDEDFYLKYGAQIIVETAEYWTSRAEWNETIGRYVIRNTMGPDEIHGGIDNNAYTNRLAAWHLRRAVHAAEDLRKAGQWESVCAESGIAPSRPEQWAKIAELMYEPFNPQLGFHEQFDGYLKLAERKIDRTMSRMQYTGPVQHSFKPTKVAQQADTILMYYMFADDFPPEMRRKAWRYYEPRCSHTSSLSRCIFSAVAAQVGMVREAYRMFVKSAENDIAAGAEEETENGIHAACMGGTWQAAVMGFAGFHLRNGEPAFDPRLPPRWKRMRFRLKVRGADLAVEIRRTEVRLASDRRARAWVCGRPVEAGPRPVKTPISGGSSRVAS